MFRRSASSLLLAGLLFADGSWLGRLEQLFQGLLGGKGDTQAIWVNSVCDCGGSIDPNGLPAAFGQEPAIGLSVNKGGKTNPED